MYASGILAAWQSHMAFNFNVPEYRGSAITDAEISKRTSHMFSFNFGTGAFDAREEIDRTDTDVPQEGHGASVDDELATRASAASLSSSSSSAAAAAAATAANVSDGKDSVAAAHDRGGFGKDLGQRCSSWTQERSFNFNFHSRPRNIYLEQIKEAVSSIEDNRGKRDTWKTSMNAVTGSWKSMFEVVKTPAQKRKLLQFASAQIMRDMLTYTSHAKAFMQAAKDRGSRGEGAEVDIVSAMQALVDGARAMTAFMNADQLTRALELIVSEDADLREESTMIDFFVDEMKSWERDLCNVQAAAAILSKSIGVA